MSMAIERCRTVADLSHLVLGQLRSGTIDPALRQLVGLHRVGCEEIGSVLERGHFAIVAGSRGEPGRRAFAYGYATDDGLQLVGRMLRGNVQLRANRFQPRPGERFAPSVVVIWDQENLQPPRSFPFKVPSQILASLPSGAPPELRAALVRATQVIVFDSEYGRHDLLWHALRAAFA